MKNKVVGLFGREIFDPSKDADPAVIAQAEDLLARCKSGEVNGFAVALHYRDEAVGAMKIGVISFSLAGKLHALTNKVIAEMG